MKNVKYIFAAALMALTLCSCGESAKETEEDAALNTAQTTEAPSDGSMSADFSAGASDLFEISDGWTNGNMFNVTWRKSNCTFNDGLMQLIIDNDSTPAAGIPYSGAEYRSKEHYGYGRYEVTMKPIVHDGVVSSFFTYTGPSEGNPWDEIDIEFLGKDTTKVQFNYFTNGQGNHEYLHDLGFNAADDFHSYGFEWHKDKIVWFVDGEEVYTAEENIPVTESKIMMNAWCGTGVDSWLNAFDGSNLPLTAEYKSTSFTPFDE